ncbi:MAG TPA: bifunctional phosphoribosyl-AMP cyclohydrolase/phosphoribosyl-ATP diphosphatase HisIE [Longimicrobiales bacterium]|nr:bifunctional phosphoribosyl-AMP cyclohydrolase/phosphoribosyl-ATP diphosphatase HisIE [Longimicrobiales bacterium]
MRIENEDQLDRLDFAKGQGLVPVVAQHARTGEVLMVGYANREALARTLETGVVWYYSRSRQRLWQKGETSGNVHRLVSLHTDCDGDAIVARVDPAGPTCHTGDWSCFGAPPTLAALSAVLQERLAAPPERSYTAKLLADRNLRLKKLGEEALELALACADEDRERVAEEAADVVYHTLVACLAAGVPPERVLAALERRLPASVAAAPGAGTRAGE